MENRKAKCPLGGDGTQDCYGCTYPCSKNKKKSTTKNKCPHGGDIENDCADCTYSGEYHYRDGDCVERRPQRRMTPYERTRAAVYATGNRWAIENFNATHN